MTWRLITAAPSWPVRRVAEVMAASRVRRLPVMDGPDIVGLISDTDVFTSLVEAHTWDHVRQARKARALARLSRTEPANTVADLMSAPVLAISGDATVQQAVEKMVSAGISSLLVEEEQVPHGIITKRDVVIKLVAAGRDPREAAVRTVASDPVQTIGFEATLEECSARMAVVGTRRLPVTRGGTIVGIISDSDILAAAAGHRWFGHRRAPTTAVAADFMRPPVAELQPVWTDALTPELSIWDCAERLMQAGARELPVVQEGRIIGIVSESDIVRALQERGGPD
jgi:CBS domain-containing protein